MNAMPIMVGVLVFASMLDANAADPLPGSMSGRYSGVGSRGSVSYEVSVVIEKQDPDGTVEGKLTRFGYRCGAKGEPFKGTWDGTQFRFTSMGRANVNTGMAAEIAEKMNMS